MLSIFKPLSSRQLNNQPILIASRRFSKERLRTDLCSHYQIQSDYMVRASFIGLGETNKSELKKDQLFIPIHLEQHLHYGPHFAASLSLWDTHVNGCVFAIDDALQALSDRILQPNVPIEELIQKRRQEGDKWITDNSHLLAKLNISWKIIRWKSIMEHTSFPYYLGVIHKTYRSNANFKAICDKSAEAYLKRNQGHPMCSQKAEKLCLAYLFRECASLFIVLDERCQWHVYPRDEKPAMRAVYDLLIQPKYPKALQPLKLRHRKVNHYKKFLGKELEYEMKSEADSVKTNSPSSN